MLAIVSAILHVVATRYIPVVVPLFFLVLLQLQVFFELQFVSGLDQG